MIPLAGRSSIDDQLDIDATRLGPNQHLDDAGAGHEAIRADQDLTPRAVDCAGGDRRTILLQRETHRQPDRSLPHRRCRRRCE
jgi:hypothetical protein